ncbi:hypothetical protein NUH87_06035 [Pseudomonas batumici]|uniref:hypothetical protein n=1 Tax=Pseudomonas batumici TaxID=226910 RepID=UPI0030CF89E2
MRDPASKYDLSYTESQLNQNISNQGDKLDSSVRYLRTSIKEQSESIATLSKTVVDQHRELRNKIADDIVLKIREEHERVKERRTFTIMSWLTYIGAVLALFLVILAPVTKPVSKPGSSAPTPASSDISVATTQCESTDAHQ